MSWTTEETQEFISKNVWILGVVMFLGLAGFLPGWTSTLQSHRFYNSLLFLLIGLTSGSLGWGLGILLTPIGLQGNSARVLSSAFGSFWTGVVVSHIEAISKSLMGMAHDGMGQAMKVRLLYALGIFLMTVFATMNSRFPEATDQPKPPTSSQSFP